MSINRPSYCIRALSAPLDMMLNAPRRTMQALGLTLLGAIAPVALPAPAPAPAVTQIREQVRVVFEHPLPNAAGKKMVAVLVSYPPGAKSLAHRHAASAFIYAYVVSGAIRSRVGNEPAKVYHTGEGFYEMPGSHHEVSENASDQEPASLLAIFVVESKDSPLTTPDQSPVSQ